MGIAELFGRRGVISTSLELPVLPDYLDAPAARDTFSTAVGSDYDTWQALVAGVSPLAVSRHEALSVPAVLRCRNLICATLATLPLAATNAAGERVDHALLAQPEAPLGLVRSVTIANTLEDLLLEGAALWLVLLRNAAGFPTAVQRVDNGTWTQDPDTRVIRIHGREVDAADVIYFASPQPALLTAGARAIRALLQLERTAALYAEEPEPSVSWAAADGVDPDEDDVRAFLQAWVAARKTRATAFVPAAFKRLDGQRMTADELQLGEARKFAITEVGRLAGVDPEDLGVSTTSRTYQNAVDRRRALVDFTLAPLMHALEERLSLGDVTPRGQQVRFNLNGFLRAATTERLAAYATAISAGVYTVAECRALEDLPPLEGTA